MILKSLRLKNIRSYKEQQIEFPEGSVMLAGDIGSGKSSIFHAVEFALFGARRDSISGDALLRKGEKEGEVELAFSLDGRDITIRRKLKRQQDSVAQDAGFIVIEGRRIDGTATELKALLLALLGYPKEFLTKSKSLIYRYTVYTPQEEMKQIITEPDEVRVDTLRRVFSIDKYKRISGNAELYVQWIKEAKKGLQGTMQGLDEKKTELERMGDRASLADSMLKEAMQKLDMVMMEKDSAKSALAALEERVSKLTELRKKSSVCDARLMEIVRNRSKNNTEIEHATAELDQLRKRLGDSRTDEKQHPPVEEIENWISLSEKKLSEHSSRKAELAERHKQLLRRTEELKQDVLIKSGKTSVTGKKELLYQELLEEIKDKQAMTDTVAAVTARLKETETILAELNACKKAAEQLKRQVTSLQTCPTCMQEVTQVHKHAIIADEDRKIQNAESEILTLSKEKAEIVGLIAGHDLRLQELAAKERELAAVKVELANLETVKAELDSLLKIQKNLDEEKLGIISALEKLDEKMMLSLSEEVAVKKQLLREAHKHNLELKERQHNELLLSEKEQRKRQLENQQELLKEEVRQINAEKLVISEEISKLGHAEQESADKKKGYEKILLEEKSTEVRLGEARKEKEGITNQMMMLSKDIKQKEDASAKLLYLNSVQEWLEKMLINIMSTMERQVMARVHIQFSELFSTWFNMIIEEEALSVKIDENFLPVVMQNGHDTSLEHLSGGERTSVALAYRLALNRVINDVVGNIKTKDLLILDEPTDGFSSEQLDKVRNVLEELNVKQTIIVSHESKIESFVDHVIRIHKNEHVSRVVS
jgi:exonuclease SbcC